jgi:SAM-dependent methyltransferase
LQFGVAPAEASGLQPDSVDLITVAQALHWFDTEQFFAEAARVLKPGGVLSYWCYEHSKVNRQCDQIVRQIFAEVEDYWPPERELVERRYVDIDFPLPEIRAEKFSMQTRWTAEDLLAYARTWSASQRYIADKGTDPTMAHAAELCAAWGTERRTVCWPITLRLGRK